MDRGKGGEKKQRRRCHPFSPSHLPFAQIFIEKEASVYETEDLSSAASFFLRPFFRRHSVGKPVVASRKRLFLQANNFNFFFKF